MFLRNLLQASAILPFLYATSSAQTACNNSPLLCNRAYNNITHLGAHDSPFLRDQTTGFSTSGNQNYNSTVQLDAGVRLLSAQVHKKNGTTGEDMWHLCHSSCDLLDMGTLANWLRNISTWMNNNPNEVVTVLIVDSDDATPAQLGAQFEASGIDKIAYTPPSTETVPKTWPTLQSLISNGTRLMTFVASITADPAVPYLMDEFSFIFENDFENESPTDYKCTPNRPSALKTAEQAADSGKMFLMNHFLYSSGLFGIQTPNETYANITNAQTGLGSLGTAIKTCTGVYSKPPTFVLTDFFNRGPAMASVDDANGVTSATGRTPVSTEPLEEDTTSGVMKRQGNIFAVVVAVVAAVAFSI
ncbi:hypothetical protein K505DRAFT_326631 [Melanomma pulvis-pyrius CBS 109.77]|uniref:PLC-like phosphodiesterase n=1 Tax=Melanomma pulvis-pyrius CBS 109.77 TaxID=1314802 RepID=A0A6A6X681_9PLEO|nr:hypothetical protein K505DRAFT_326631 [Melanomma pulvis-pyrius CBS 109.77]